MARAVPERGGDELQRGHQSRPVLARGSGGMRQMVHSGSIRVIHLARTRRAVSSGIAGAQAAHRGGKTEFTR
jgi:hypothetical protein